MPRYLDVDTITFTDIHGNSYPVKDIRPISTQVLNFTIPVKDGDLLDEIATRPEVFGDFAENQAWRIFDLNIAELAEANFDLSKLKRLKIPIR
jgi:hypothetical protein